MTTPTKPDLPKEFWVIVSEAVPFMLAATPVGETSVGRATIVATLIVLHLWVSAVSGRPSIPMPPSAEDLEDLWHEYGDVLIWAGDASGDASDDARTTAFDSRATSDLIEEATTFWWRASRFMQFRALLRGEPFGFDR